MYNTQPLDKYLAQAEQRIAAAPPMGINPQRKDSIPSPPLSNSDNTPRRHMVNDWADTATLKPVTWTWTGRIPQGALSLLAGREGIGKSSIAYDLAAQLTTGHLDGHWKGTPKPVAVVAAEDSWEHTIVPRLVAAGADLSKVTRIRVKTEAGTIGSIDLSMSVDIKEMKRIVKKEGIAMILLDPLISRLGSLDTHKDAEVRQALEALTEMGEETGVAILGLIHLNKTRSSEPLQLVMGSRAFVAVARSVIFVHQDPDNRDKRYLGMAKNNLGRMDLPTKTYHITDYVVANTEEGAIHAGKVIWGPDEDKTLQELLGDADSAPEERFARDDAKKWLVDYLHTVGGSSMSAKVKEEARREGIAVATLDRAAAELRRKRSMVSDRLGRETLWKLVTERPNPLPQPVSE